MKHLLKILTLQIIEGRITVEAARQMVIARAQARRERKRRLDSRLGGHKGPTGKFDRWALEVTQ